jgi:hypothetical protein
VRGTRAAATASAICLDEDSAGGTSARRCRSDSGNRCCGSGYRTDRSLRRIIHRFVGPQPRQPLFDAAVTAFNVELRQCREDLRSAAAVNLNRIANPMQDADVQSYPAGLS